MKSSCDTLISNLGSCVVKCANPTVILHPYAQSYLHRCSHFCYNGNIYSLYDSNHRRVYGFDLFRKSFVSPFFQKYKVHPENTFTYDTLFDNYHFIGNDGTCFPMFCIVPCGKCAVCAHTRLNDIAARCQLETYTSKCSPLFVTLTYDDAHLPADKSVSIDDIQKFLKRLRINLNRFFSHEEIVDGKRKMIPAKISLRYIYCSEYTPTTQRPHYHLLIWNVPYFPNGLSDYQVKWLDGKLDNYPDNIYGRKIPDMRFFDSPRCPLRGSLTCDLGRMYGFDTLKKLVWLSWNKGFIKAEVSRDVSGRYVAKYLGKGSDVPFGRTPCFVRWSTRRGLGYDAFDKCFRDVLIKNPKLTQLTFIDPKNGKLTKCCIPKYYRNLLAPSLSVLAKDFRTTLETCRYAYCSLKFLYNCGVYLPFASIKSDWTKIFNKYEVFQDLCLLSVNPLSDSEKNDLRAIAFDCKTLFHSGAYSHVRIIHDVFIDCVYTLGLFDLDSIHLQDVLDYKYLSTLARIDYAQKHPQSIQRLTNSAVDSFAKLHRRAVANDM